MRRLGTFLRLCHRRFVRGDRMAGFRLLAALGGRLAPGYRFVDPTLDWLDDREFANFLDRFDATDGLDAHRKWMVAQLLRLTRDLPGDTAECGVFRGATSHLICASNVGTGKTHHLFDSFEGLSQPAEGDGAYWSAGDLACSEEEVRERLGAFEAVRFHRGWIPERFDDVGETRFSFVHVDVDLAEPTAASVEFFHPRLVEGGILVCDDYGFTTCPGSTRAIDAFLSGRPERMLPLPTGGGFLVKGRATDSRTRIFPHDG